MKLKYILSTITATLIPFVGLQAQKVAHVNYKSGKHYAERTAQFERQIPIDSSLVVMLGDSHTEGGGDWNLLLGTGNVVNRGINGDTARGIEERLIQILPGDPKAVFLLCGANDLSHGLSSDVVAERMIHLVMTIQEQAPKTKLIVQSLLPINESFGKWKSLKGRTDDIPLVNERLEAYCLEHNIPYINLFIQFTNGDDNVLMSDLSSDGLHLNHDGYELWAEILQPYMDWVNGKGDASLFFEDAYGEEEPEVMP